MTGRLRSTLIGVGVLVAFALSLGLALTAGKGLPWSETTDVSVAFRDVGALRPGDDVRLANVRVGQVESVELVDHHAVARLQLEGDRPIYRNATAVVAARSSLGQKFVDLDPGDASAGELGSNEIIPITHTRQAHEISELLEVLDKRTRAALGSTLRQAGGGAAGHGQDLRDLLAGGPSLLPDLGKVSRSVTADGGADLEALLSATKRLSDRFAQKQEGIGELVGQMDQTLRAVAVDNGQPLQQTLEKAPRALGELRTALQNVRRPLADTGEAARRLQPGARSLGLATPDIRGVLREGVAPLQKLPAVAEQAEPAVVELSGMFADARPLAPRLTQAFNDAQVPLAVLRPYAPEIAMLFNNAGNALSQGDQSGHWLRIFLNIGAEDVLGGLPVEDPTVSRNVYPAPGKAVKDKETSLIGKRGN